MNYNEIQPQLYIGSYPQDKSDIKKLHAELNIVGVLCLQSRYDFTDLGVDADELRAGYLAHEIEWQQVPIVDLDDRSLGDRLPCAVRVLAQLMKRGGAVFVHCTAGYCRAPTVVAAYLHRVQGLDVDDAVAIVCRARRCHPSAQAIREADWDAV